MKITIALLFLPVLLFSQKRDVCSLLKKNYMDEIHGKYRKLYIADSVYLLEIGSEKIFISNFQDFVPKKLLKKAFSESKITRSLQKISCFDDSLLGNKKDLLKYIRKQGIYLGQKDSSFIKYVDDR